VGVCIALVGLTAACASEDDPSGAMQTAPAESEQAEPSAEAPAGGGEVLLATVGEPDDPDAFTITLTDESGAEVSTLPAGSYSIRVDDLSEIHNFHLTGSGVDESTTVPETGDTVWDVTLEAGDYQYVCDPHPSMRGELTVT